MILIEAETNSAPAWTVAHPLFLSVFTPLRQIGKVRGAGGTAKGAAKGSAVRAGVCSAAERREQDFSDLRDWKAEVVRERTTTNRHGS